MFSANPSPCSAVYFASFGNIFIQKRHVFILDNCLGGANGALSVFGSSSLKRHLRLKRQIVKIYFIFFLGVCFFFFVFLFGLFCLFFCFCLVFFVFWLFFLFGSFRRGKRAKRRKRQ